VIFVTVGTQLAFDRMIKAVDQWAGKRARTDVVAQIGPAQYKPHHIQSQEFMTPAECRAKMIECTAIVAHAGMGTILTALELGKPLIIVPRREDLGEHRNDHQLATARRFAELGSVTVAFDENELRSKLDELDKTTAVAERISPHASPRLLAAVRAFINGQPIPAHTSATTRAAASEKQTPLEARA
jgi:UDP-N-acetylglucosamine transferase subunit ALG13